MSQDVEQPSWCESHQSSTRQDWYARPPKHKQLLWTSSFKSSPWCKKRETAPAPDDPTEWQSMRGQLAHVARAIESSRRVLDMVDEDGNALARKGTWERAVTFLNNYARRVWSYQGVKIETPDINPGPDGSIDIHWDRPGYEMLMNVPADVNAPITFYGDDRQGNAVKGKVVSSNNRGLILWLATATNK